MSVVAAVSVVVVVSVFAAAVSVVAAGVLVAQPAIRMDIDRTSANTTANVFFMVILPHYFL